MQTEPFNRRWFDCCELNAQRCEYEYEFESVSGRFGIWMLQNRKISFPILVWINTISNHHQTTFVCPTCTLHTHTLCFYSRAKVRQFRYYRARASECIEISSNNAMRKVLWCDQMNIEYRFCSRNEHKNIIAPVLQSLFVRKMAISVRIYVRISYIRPRLWLAWLQSIGSVCFIRNVVVRWTQAQMKVCSVIFCQNLRFMHCNLWPELWALLLWI